MNPEPDSNGCSAAPLVSVVVPCRNEVKAIAHCVEGLCALHPPAGGYEIVVADGMSSDGTRAILEHLKSELAARRSKDGGQGAEVRVIENPGLIASTGLNAAIRAARGRIIVRADAHTSYAADYLLECVSALELTGADNVGGPARTRAGHYMQEVVAAAYHSPFSVGGARFHDVGYEGWVDTVTYGCWWKSGFNKFGPFDEALVRNQDDEHNLRITRAGGRIWQSPKIRSWYEPRGSLSALFRQYRQYGYWKVRVIRKHKLPASWRHLVPGVFVLVLLGLSLFSVLNFLLSRLAFHAAWPALRSPVLDLSFHVSSLGFALISAAYLLAVLAASLHAAARTRWGLLPVLPVVFGCYHFGYGIGFLRGIWDWGLPQRAGRPDKFSALTR